MPRAHIIRDGEVVNTILVSEHCIAITKAEAEAMAVEWFREWDFYILPDGCELALAPQQIAEVEPNTSEIMAVIEAL